MITLFIFKSILIRSRRTFPIESVFHLNAKSRIFSGPIRSTFLFSHKSSRKVQPLLLIQKDGPISFFPIEEGIVCIIPLKTDPFNINFTVYLILLLLFCSNSLPCLIVKCIKLVQLLSEPAIDRDCSYSPPCHYHQIIELAVTFPKAAS